MERQLDWSQENPLGVLADAWDPLELVFLELDYPHIAVLCQYAPKFCNSDRLWNKLIIRDFKSDYSHLRPEGESAKDQYLAFYYFDNLPRERQQEYDVLQWLIDLETPQETMLLTEWLLEFLHEGKYSKANFLYDQGIRLTQNQIVDLVLFFDAEAIAWLVDRGFEFNYSSYYNYLELCNINGEDFGQFLVDLVYYRVVTAREAEDLWRDQDRFCRSSLTEEYPSFESYRRSHPF